MSDDKPIQTPGRDDNGAIPLGKPDASTSDAAVKRTGEREKRSAGPDGPDATEVGDTFKNQPG
ncbi:hypothetical protein N0B44_16670 [Roseibacterium beibuensis]|uniref:hypothetical protein n=1 Tax=[Roseibacterium] beibuensis TaxID=1193142 RepID=UPI00217CF4BF|nr:hypothetical protein [Roseibacterium beibuensis]MCS6624552.1 hypothetical protein [Roseibacterium beibuensis]